MKLNNVSTGAGLALRPALVFIIASLFLISTASPQSKLGAADSILGVRIGMTPSEADEALEKVGEHADDAEGEIEDGESKELWNIRGTAFRSIVIKRGKSGRIGWVSGFVRPGKEIPFSELGDLMKASRSTPNEVVWNVPDSSGGFKLVAKGSDRKATIVYLLSLAAPPADR